MLSERAPPGFKPGVELVSFFSSIFCHHLILEENRWRERKAVAVYLFRLLGIFVLTRSTTRYIPANVPDYKKSLRRLSGHFTGYPCGGEGVHYSRRQYLVECKGGGFATPQLDATPREVSVGWAREGRKGGGWA